MGIEGERELFAAADQALPLAERALLGDLAVFVSQRLQAAAQVREHVDMLLGSSASLEKLQPEVHTFLRECWDALDGLGRQINVCLYDLFPDAGLDPPERMTRQCTFYTVRRALHNAPTASMHPISRLLWSETRTRPGPAYARLSFLYNLCVFVPVPLPGGEYLPGSDDVSPHLKEIVRASQVDRCDVVEGLDEMLQWLGGFAGRCYGLMARALEEGNRG